MTLFEFYKGQLDSAKETSRWFDEDDSFLSEKYGHGSFEWFKAMSKRYFGGGLEQRYLKAGISREQLKDARANGFVKYVYDQSWEARQLKTQDWWGLTVKGLKAMYAEYKGTF